jgi:GH24 family phage-related lysozyme (muramidase)
VASKPKGWDEDFDYTDEMASYIDKLAIFENSIGAGLKDDRYFPHESLEGGKKTIAFGHKLKKGENFSKGISITRAKEILIEDTMAAYKRAYNSYRNKYSKKDWNNLSNKSKVVLTELSFNIGNTKDYEEAFYNKNKKEVIRLIRERGYTEAEGDVNKLGTRNESIIGNYIISDDWSEEASYMKEWNKEDNIFA